MLLTGMILGIPIIMSSKPSPLKSPTTDPENVLGGAFRRVMPSLEGNEAASMIEVAPES